MHDQEVKGLLSAQNGMNIYRGCTHGCIYCDARSDCYHMDHAFEDIAVKVNAPTLLEDALRRKRKRCMIGTGAMCDPYMPIEKEIGYTRKCLEIIERYGFGLAIQTKSADILRDLDLLKRINQKARCVVQMTLTTYDEALCRIVEPNVSTTRERYEALCTLRDNGIPTVVWLSPILPFINDTMENLDGILDDCVRAKVAGILCFGMGVTLRDGNREYFYQKLDAHFPGLKQRYIDKYGYAYEVASDNNAALMRRFTAVCRDNGILYRPDDVFSYLRRFDDAADKIRLF